MADTTKSATTPDLGDLFFLAHVGRESGGAISAGDSGAEVFKFLDIFATVNLGALPEMLRHYNGIDPLSME